MISEKYDDRPVIHFGKIINQIFECLIGLVDQCQVLIERFAGIL